MKNICLILFVGCLYSTNAQNSEVNRIIGCNEPSIFIADKWDRYVSSLVMDSILENRPSPKDLKANKVKKYEAYRLFVNDQWIDTTILEVDKEGRVYIERNMKEVDYKFSYDSLHRVILLQDFIHTVDEPMVVYEYLYRNDGVIFSWMSDLKKNKKILSIDTVVVDTEFISNRNYIIHRRRNNTIEDMFYVSDTLRSLHFMDYDNRNEKFDERMRYYAYRGDTVEVKSYDKDGLLSSLTIIEKKEVNHVFYDSKGEIYKQNRVIYKNAKPVKISKYMFKSGSHLETFLTYNEKGLVDMMESFYNNNLYERKTFYYEYY